MRLPFQITFNAVLMILTGLGLMAFGFLMIIRPYSRLFGAGFFLTGVGNLFFGMTNGFTHMTSTGRLLYRFGVAAYFVGIPIIAYYMFIEIF